MGADDLVPGGQHPFRRGNRGRSLDLVHQSPLRVRLHRSSYHRAPVSVLTLVELSTPGNGPAVGRVPSTGDKGRLCTSEAPPLTAEISSSPGVPVRAGSS